MPIYMGKEAIKMNQLDKFKELAYVKRALEGKSLPDPFVINCVHGDHVCVLPSDLQNDDLFVHHGSSERTPHELWTYGTQILSMQAHPELNHYIIQKFIIDRLSKLGALNEKRREFSENELYRPDRTL